jgi:hypothetical protein
MTADTRSRFDDRQWAALQQALAQIAVRLPGWTGGRGGDPGVTLLELSAVLVEELVSRGAITEGGLPAVSRIEDALSSLAWRTGPEVSVDGERWEYVASLAEASPDARVYSIDHETGILIFGDGTHGRRPPDGSRIAARFRHGSGRKGDLTVTIRGSWPLPESACRVVSSSEWGS